MIIRGFEWHIEWVVIQGPHLLTAVYHAILAHIQASLRTRTVHSEVLWALNPSNNASPKQSRSLWFTLTTALQITEAIRRYGVSDATKAVLVVRVAGSDSGMREKMQAVVDGTLRPLNELSNVTDWASIKKVRLTKKFSCPSIIMSFSTVQ